MFNNSDEHSQAEIPLIKYSYHTDTQSLATVCCVYVCVCLCVCTCSWIPLFSVCCSSVQPESWWPEWFSPVPFHLPGCHLPADSGVPTTSAHLSAGTWQHGEQMCRNFKYLQEQIRVAESPWEGTEQMMCLRMNLLKKLFPEEPRYFKPFIKFFIAVIC